GRQVEDHVPRMMLQPPQGDLAPVDAPVVQIQEDRPLRIRFRQLVQARHELHAASPGGYPVVPLVGCDIQETEDRLSFVGAWRGDFALLTDALVLPADHRKALHVALVLIHVGRLRIEGACRRHQGPVSLPCRRRLGHRLDDQLRPAEDETEKSNQSYQTTLGELTSEALGQMASQKTSCPGGTLGAHRLGRAVQATNGFGTGGRTCHGRPPTTREVVEASQARGAKAFQPRGDGALIHLIEGGNLIDRIAASKQKDVVDPLRHATEGTALLAAQLLLLVGCQRDRQHHERPLPVSSPPSAANSPRWAKTYETLLIGAVRSQLSKFEVELQRSLI